MIDCFALSKSMRNGLYLILYIAALTACQHEIDFDYHTVEPLLMIEGRLTNEGTEVVITKTRDVTDSVRSLGLPGAQVVVTGEGIEENLLFNAETQSYCSSFAGVPGQTYTLSILYEGQRYEGTSTMPAPAPVQSVEFLWQPVLSERLLAYEMWAIDPEPDERNYYWYRMDRRSHHPHLEGKRMTEAYRWNVFDDRGCPPGLVYRDIICMSERDAEEDDEDNWKSILYEGDTITLTLMTIDQPTFDFFRTLRSGQSGGANPRGNIVGPDCLGYFAAGSVVHADTVVFSYDKIR